MDSRGKDLLKLARGAEMRIVNGLRLDGSTLAAAGTATRALPDLEPEDPDQAGTVLDYVLSTEAPLHSFSRLHVGVDQHLTDHRPVHLTWKHFEHGQPIAAASLSCKHLFLMSRLCSHTFFAKVYLLKIGLWLS